jgi:hypothetical protein
MQRQSHGCGVELPRMLHSSVSLGDDPMVLSAAYIYDPTLSVSLKSQERRKRTVDPSPYLWKIDGFGIWEPFVLEVVPDKHAWVLEGSHIDRSTGYQCQRHEQYSGQWRATEVRNCTVDTAVAFSMAKVCMGLVPPIAVWKLCGVFQQKIV